MNIFSCASLFSLCFSLVTSVPHCVWCYGLQTFHDLDLIVDQLIEIKLQNFKYLSTRVTDENSIQKVMTSRLNLVKVC
jgi:hypothetical protein